MLTAQVVALFPHYSRLVGLDSTVELRKLAREELYARVVALMYRRDAYDANLADDICQEVFLRVAESEMIAKYLPAPGGPVAYIDGILKMVVKECLGKKIGEDVVAHGLSEDWPVPGESQQCQETQAFRRARRRSQRLKELARVREREPDSSTLIERKDTIQMLNKLTEKLPPRQREEFQEQYREDSEVSDSASKVRGEKASKKRPRVYMARHHAVIRLRSWVRGLM